MNLFDELSNSQIPEWAKRIVVFDTETTGLNLKESRIVSACAIELDANGQIASANGEWLANPGIEIPESASNVHGITTAYAQENGAPAAQVVREIVETLRSYLAQGVPIVAYNAPYDFTILHYEALRHGVEPLSDPAPVIDPLILFKHFHKYRKGKKNLEAACEVYGVDLGNAHNATADAVASGRVLQAMARQHAADLPSDLRLLHDLQVIESKKQDLSFQDFMRKANDPNFTVELGWPQKL